MNPPIWPIASTTRDEKIEPHVGMPAVIKELICGVLLTISLLSNKVLLATLTSGRVIILVFVQTAPALPSLVFMCLLYVHCFQI